MVYKLRQLLRENIKIVIISAEKNCLKSLKQDTKYMRSDMFYCVELKNAFDSVVEYLIKKYSCLNVPTTLFAIKLERKYSI